MMIGSLCKGRNAIDEFDRTQEVSTGKRLADDPLDKYPAGQPLKPCVNFRLIQNHAVHLFIRVCARGRGGALGSIVIVA
jgi:hypothetical protein